VGCDISRKKLPQQLRLFPMGRRLRPSCGQRR